MKTGILVIGLFLVILVGVSGCTSNGTETNLKEYNGSYMSFHYPQEFKLTETNTGRTIALTGNGNILINIYSDKSGQDMLIIGLGTPNNLTQYDTPFNYTTFKTKYDEEVMYFTKEGKYYVINYSPPLKEKVLIIVKTINSNQ